MLNHVKFMVLAILCSLVAAPSLAAEKAAAKVNGVAIPQSRVDWRVKIAIAQGQPDSPELRNAIREDMINLELLVQNAKKLKLDKDADVEMQTRFAQQSVLAGAYVQDYAKKNPISDEQLKQEYERLKASVGESEYNVRHILVETAAEAGEIIAQLDKEGGAAAGSNEVSAFLGDRFSELAKEKSRDAGSAERGGSLGWAVPTNFVPPFANAMVKLKKGEHTSEPVQSQFGWHVIRLDDVRNLKMPSYEEMKPQILQRLQQQAVQDMVSKLRGKAKIE